MNFIYYTKEHLDIIKGIQVLENEIQSLTFNTNIASSILISFNDELNELNRDILVEINLINGEINLIKNSGIEYSMKSYVEPKKSEVINDTSKNKKLCKKLFVKISAKCHPDKTKNYRHIEMFMDSCKAYKNLDVHRLQIIFSSLKSKKKIQPLYAKVFSDDKLKHDAMKVSFNDLIKNYNKLINSESYNDATKYKHLSVNDKEKYKNIIRNNLIQSLVNKKIELAKVKDLFI